jgi:cobalt/nickel transport system permease protein
MTRGVESISIHDSPLARLDPRGKLLSFALGAITVATLRSLVTAGAALGLSLLVMAAARFPTGWALRRLGVVSLALAPVALLLPLFQGETGLHLAVLLLLKALAITAQGLGLISTTPSMATAWSARTLGVPASLVRLSLLTHRFSFVLSDELARMRSAMRVRGFRAAANSRSIVVLGGLVGILFLRGADRAERVAQAQHCRGDDGQFRLLDPPRFHWCDAALVTGVLFSSGFLLVWNLYLN